jgi:hypothetical protein
MPILKEQNGCILSLEHRPDGDLYVMSGGRTGRHAMSAEYTDEKRIKAHWKGYLAANPLIKYKVHYVRENQYREYNAKGEKVARRRLTHRTVMACNIADATAQAKAYSRRFYPQCYFTLEGVEEVSK